MTDLHFYDNMPEVVVRGHYCAPIHQTQLWLSDAVLEAIDEYEQSYGPRYMSKVEYYAKAGFRNHEGTRSKSKNQPGIRPKTDYGHVLAIQPFGLFRIYGFYENPQKTVFIGVSTTMKRGMKMRAKDKEACQFAADVCESGKWRKEGT